MPLERRDGMGCETQFLDKSLTALAAEPKTEMPIAQEVIAERGQPFDPLEQVDAPLRTDIWDGHHARVTLIVAGQLREGYGSSISSNPAEAYKQAYLDALYLDFPQLRDVRSPILRDNNLNGSPHTELEFSMGSQRWISRNGGLAKNNRELGTLIAEGLMAGIHLITKKS